MALNPEAFGRIHLFDKASPAARRELALRAIERTFEANEVLFTAGAAPRGFFVILEGEVRVLRGGGGRQHVIHVEGPGGTLGEVALFDGGGYPATAIASRWTRCAIFNRDAVEAAIAADPALAWIFFGRLAERARRLVDRLDRMAAYSVTDRLAALLLMRSRGAGGGEFSIGRTQSEVAEELGTVREVLVRSLRELCTAGVIRRTSRGRYEVMDPAELARRGSG